MPNYKNLQILNVILQPILNRTTSVRCYSIHKCDVLVKHPYRLFV